ncbi:MAG: hypothetical protein H6581_26090 [Bacteroidia bacterium]|nr:hypothetical protein [Bacteroidia bacterium]
MTRMKFVAFGDSVMWGQGLKEEHKFVIKAAQGIAAREGKTWEVTNYAHSGAVIRADENKRRTFVEHFPWLFANQAAIDNFMNGKDERMTVFQGEVPNSFPTIPWQVDSFDPNAVDSVDVVYLDGGANDVDFEQFLDPEGMNFSEDNSKLHDAIQIRLKDLVLRTRKKFPNALIALMGFYPIFSERSRHIKIRHVFYWKKVYEGQQSWNEIAANENLLEDSPLLREWFGGVDVEEEVRKSIRRVFNAFQYGSYEIRKLVEDLGDPNLILCEPKFDFEQSLFAPRSCVNNGWMLAGENKITGFWVTDGDLGGPADLVHDEVFETRSQTMDQLYNRYLQAHGLPDARKKTLAEWGKKRFHEHGKRVSFLHPNANGAQLYTDQILSRYDRWKEISLRDQLVRSHERVTSLQEFKARYHAESDSARALALNASVDYFKLDFDSFDHFQTAVSYSQAFLKVRINGTNYEIPLWNRSIYFSLACYVFSYLTWREFGIPEFNISDVESVEFVADVSKGSFDVLSIKDVRTFQGVSFYIDGKIQFRHLGEVDIREQAVNDIYRLKLM